MCEFLGENPTMSGQNPEVFVKQMAWNPAAARHDIAMPAVVTKNTRHDKQDHTLGGIRSVNKQHDYVPKLPRDFADKNPKRREKFIPFLHRTVRLLPVLSKRQKYALTLKHLRHIMPNGIDYERSRHGWKTKSRNGVLYRREPELPTKLYTSDACSQSWSRRTPSWTRTTLNENSKGEWSLTGAS